MIFGRRDLPDAKNKFIPKTYTTRKGQLLIFSEDYTSAHDADDAATTTTPGSLLFSSSTREFRREILDYGRRRTAARLSLPLVFDRENTLAAIATQRLDTDSIDRVRPGYSAKRYLASLTKRWKPDLVDR